MSNNELEKFIILLSVLLNIISWLIIWMNYRKFKNALEMVCFHLIKHLRSVETISRPNVGELSRALVKDVRYGTHSQVDR